MILLIDVGNTKIKFAVVKDSKIVNKFLISTNPEMTADELFFEFSKFINIENIKDVVISSVIPKVTTNLEKAFTELANMAPTILGPGTKTKIKIVTDNPKEVGADLIAGCMGASSNHDSTCLIIDLGTATKYTFMKNNVFMGVSIAPGVEISLNALTKSGALLPDVTIKPTNKVICTNTIECIQSGVIYPTIEAVTGMIHRIRREVGINDLKVVITGGLSKLIIDYLPNDVVYDDDLIFKGLIKLHEYNVK